MSNRGIKITVLVLLGVILAVGITLFSAMNDKDFAVSAELYFFNEDSTVVEKEMREIVYNKPKEIIPGIIKEINKGSRQADKKRIIKNKIKLKEIIYEGDGYAVVDLKDSFLSGDSSSDVLAAYSVIKSICSVYPVTGITNVKITVDGASIETTDGKALEYHTYQDIQLSNESNSLKKEVLLYFKNSDKEGLGAEIRSVEVTDGVSIEKTVVEALLKGPKSNKLKQCVFGELISAETKDGVCFVNFNFSFVEKNFGDGAEYAIQSVVNSLTELSEVNEVQILIDGKKIDKIGDVDVATPLKSNAVNV